MGRAAKITNVLSSNKWYHGTTLDGYNNIKERGVIVDYNIGHQLDFGFGFYLAPTAKMAESYISRTMGWNDSDEPLVIMEYEFTPTEWEKNDGCVIGAYPAFDDEFAEFVFLNRTENIFGEKPHPFDLVYGVMSDSIPTREIMEYKAGTKTREQVLEALKKSNSMKQLSLHKQELCDKIILCRAYLYDPATDSREELH